MEQELLAIEYAFEKFWACLLGAPKPGCIEISNGKERCQKIDKIYMFYSI